MEQKSLKSCGLLILVSGVFMVSIWMSLEADHIFGKERYPSFMSAHSLNAEVLTVEYNKRCPWAPTNSKECGLHKNLYTPGKQFHKLLEDNADHDRRLFLASLDYAYVPMGLNLYETSFLKHNITNYVFICSDRKAVDSMHQHNISCFDYGLENVNTDNPSNFGTKDFNLKSHIKTKVILAALTLNFTVIITDVDIVFLKNPTPYFDGTRYDIEIQNDNRNKNSGFYLAKPTNSSIELHQHILNYETVYMNDQTAMNHALREMKNRIQIRELDKTKFPCGLYYFTQKRAFAGQNPCTDCVIVHNNWIIGKGRKIYRFKEHLLWMVDEEGYYTNTKARYLAYENYIDFGKDTKKEETIALKAAFAIGFLLDRVVILPNFTCKDKVSQRCPYRLDINKLDRYFTGKYREHMFLNHPKIPDAIKTSISKPILIQTNRNISLKADVTSFQPEDKMNGASLQEIKTWFADKIYRNVSILRFDSLYGAFAGFGSGSKYKKIVKKIQKGVS